ncbi:MAG: hypothetical protein AB4352_18795 [Hormoscilla sp.]
MTKSRSLKGKISFLIAEKIFSRRGKDLLSARKGSSLGEERIFSRRGKDLFSPRKGSSLIAERAIARMTTGTYPAFEGKKGTVDSIVMGDRPPVVSEKDQWPAAAEEAHAPVTTGTNTAFERKKGTVDREFMMVCDGLTPRWSLGKSN